MRTVAPTWYVRVGTRGLEDAAIAPDRLGGSATGVFLGLYNGNYGMSLRGSPEVEILDNLGR